MSESATQFGSTVVPTLRYCDVRAAIAWLCEVFGFERKLIVANDDGTIAHAQLSFGTGMIMLGSTTDNEFGRLIRQPDEVDGAETQSPYVIVSDADAVYARVKAHGGQIVIDIRDEDYGGRGFTCRDLEGHLWNVGTYNPWS